MASEMVRYFMKGMMIFDSNVAVYRYKKQFPEDFPALFRLYLDMYSFPHHNHPPHHRCHDLARFEASFGQSCAPTTSSSHGAPGPKHLELKAVAPSAQRCVRICGKGGPPLEPG